MAFPPRLTGINELAHAFAATALAPGGVAVDCTAGNGWDALFLLESISPGGELYAFDIQKEAIDNTSTLLGQSGLTSLTRVVLLNECHSRLARHVPFNVSCFMFNLGYLPGGDKSVITRPETVISALSHALILLKSGGVITVVMYPGHEHGEHERKKVLEFASSIPEKQFRSMHLNNLNTSKPSPSLLVIQKK